MSTLLPIPGHREYSISIDGKTIVRTSGTNARRINKPLALTFHKVKGKEFPNGYYYVTLLTYDSFDVNSEPINRPCYKPVAVHRLVAKTWLNTPIDPKQTDVNHKDGNKLNNHATNLEWVTHRQNIKHSFDTGLRVSPTGTDHWHYGKKRKHSTIEKMAAAKRGKNHPKYKGDYVAEYRRFESASEAAKQLGVSNKTIINRCNNLKWRDKGWYFIPK